MAGRAGKREKGPAGLRAAFLVGLLMVEQLRHGEAGWRFWRVLAKTFELDPVTPAPFTTEALRRIDALWKGTHAAFRVTVDVFLYLLRPLDGSEVFAGRRNGAGSDETRIEISQHGTASPNHRTNPSLAYGSLCFYRLLGRN